MPFASVTDMACTWAFCVALAVGIPLLALVWLAAATVGVVVGFARGVGRWDATQRLGAAVLLFVTAFVLGLWLLGGFSR